MVDLSTRRLGRTEMTPICLGRGGAWWGASSEEETNLVELAQLKDLSLL